MDILKAGHILGISPGGMYEAQIGDNMYKVMWRARDGFAQVVRDAGGSIPIIPVFTQNIREAYKSFNFGVTRPFWVWFYEKTRAPLGRLGNQIFIFLTLYFSPSIWKLPCEAENLYWICNKPPKNSYNRRGISVFYFLASLTLFRSEAPV